MLFLSSGSLDGEMYVIFCFFVVTASLFIAAMPVVMSHRQFPAHVCLTSKSTQVETTVPKKKQPKTIEDLEAATSWLPPTSIVMEIETGFMGI